MSDRRKNTKGKNKIIELKFDVQEPMDLEMDALLQEELMREADELEAKLNSDPSLIGMGASDDLFVKIVEELKEKGIWEEGKDDAEGNSEENKLAGDDTAENNAEKDLKQTTVVRRKRRNCIMRRCGTVAAVMVLVFGVSMTSDASRRLVSQMWDAVFSNFGLRMTTNYVEEEKFIRNEDKKEIEDYQRASEELGVSGVDLGYLPVEMDYLKCEVDKNGGKVTFFYTYKDTIFQIAMVKKEAEGVHYYALDNESELFSMYTVGQEIEAKIGKANAEIVNTEKEVEAYIGQLQYGECNYILNGIISLNEMKKIIKNIYFL